MPDYDFHTLHDKEFEQLCADLIGAEHGTRNERFKRGRDKGIDGRFFCSANRAVVVQCKHWPGTPLAKLVRQLANVELPKIALLRPARYLLAVSHALSPTDKDKLRHALSPWIQSPADILGRDDLNALLGAHPEIERQHFKLWISSTAVLTTVLSHAIHERSRDMLEAARAALPRVAITSAHDPALAKLEEMRVLLICGEPGIGKTTLARQLCLEYAAKEFDVFVVTENIRDAENVLIRGKRQLVYFDDFLGRNYLEARSGHESNRIVQFIERIRQDPSKRLLLTSRTSVLAQGKAINDAFVHAKLPNHEHELAITTLTRFDKANILYHVLWHSRLDDERKEEIYKDKRYWTVIRHRGFNPRLIDFVTDPDRIGTVAVDQYWNRVLAALQNPADVWHNVFQVQLDDVGRLLVELVVLHGRQIDELQLAAALDRALRGPLGPGTRGRRDFRWVLQLVAGSMLSRELHADTGKAFVNLFNPSIGDYVLSRFAQDPARLRDLCLALRTRTALDTVRNATAAKKCSAEMLDEVARGILDASVSADAGAIPKEAVARATSLLLGKHGVNDADTRRVEQTLPYLMSEPLPHAFLDCLNAGIWGLLHGKCTRNAAISVFDAACRRDPDESELEALEALLSELETTSSELARRDRLSAVAAEFLESNARELFAIADVVERTIKSHHSVTESAAETEFGEMVEEWFRDKHIELTDDAWERVHDAYKFDRQFGDYMDELRSESDGSEKGPSPSAVCSEDMGIDELFERR